jgi:hypothetical protein
MRRSQLCALAATAAVTLASALPAMAVTQSKALTISITRPLAATVNISQNNFTWSSVTDFTNQFLPADSNANIVSGSIVSTGTSGSGSIAISAPASITGSNVANVIPISALSVTCSTSTGTGTAPTFAAPHTALVASSSTNCATWSSGALATYSFTMAMFLDDRTFPADTYTAAGFSVVATAS